jgi:hypothetical protein
MLLLGTTHNLMLAVLFGFQRPELNQTNNLPKSEAESQQKK